MSELTSKVDDLENRSRRSNLRLLNLPEKVEKAMQLLFRKKKKDISTELQRKRKRFDDVEQRLRDLKIDYGIIYPAKLKLLRGGKPRVFADPADVESFIKDLDT